MRYIKASASFHSVWRSTALRVAFVYGIYGIGFAGANILLAHALPRAEYATITLVIALMNLSVMLAPAGADGVVNRRELDPGPRLLLHVLFTSATAGIAAAAVGYFFYGLHTTLLLFLMLGVVAGGSTNLAAAKFQSLQRFGISVALSHQSANLALAAAAIAAVLLDIQRAELPFIAFVLGHLATGSYGWSKLFSERRVRPSRGEPFDWIDALSFLGVTATGTLLVQLERLAIPRLLTLDDLATFGVLAAIVISPYRLLQMSVGYTLLPRLRAAGTVSARRRLLSREGLLITSIVILMTPVIWYATPTLVEWFLADKYDLPPSLVLAALVAGFAKVLNGFAKATVTALAETRQLTYFNFLGWFSVAVAILGSVVGTRWGLTGVIYGVAMGWLVRAFAAVYLIAPSLREKPISTATSRSTSSDTDY